jgi:small-conductance mechanosensitive channel
MCAGKNSGEAASKLVRRLTALMILAAIVSFADAAFAASGQGMAKTARQDSTQSVEPRDAKDVDAFMASLSDAQARKMLHGKLLAQAAQDKPGDSKREAGGILMKLFVDWDRRIHSNLYGHAAILDRARQEMSGGMIMNNLTDGGDASDLLRTVFTLLVVCGCAFLASAAAGWLADRLLWRTSRAHAPMHLGRAGMVLSNIALRLLGFVLFFLMGFVLFVVLAPPSGPAQSMGMITVVTLAYFQLVKAIALILLNPGNAAARLIPVKDEDARMLYRWLLSIAVTCVGVALVSVILKQTGQAQALGSLAYGLAGPLVGMILSVMFVVYRKRVASVFQGDVEEQYPGGRFMLARHWHYPAILYALTVGVYWSAQAISGDVTIFLLVLSLFIIPCCIGVDIWVGKLLIVASGQEREVINLNAEQAHSSGMPSAGEAPAGKHTIRFYIPLIRKSLRGVLVIFAAFAMLKIWGVEIPLGWLFARNVLSVLMVIVGGALIWEIIRIRIDRKLSEETSLPGEEMEEGGGAGGSRSATLLMLLRKFLLCVIVVMGSLIALSSLGIDIGPLIAGAGVVGLAIGFGAQTLVKDIISGVFFLIDDAFRVGDYVEAGNAKGTVEQISLRSMKLRHPRGMVFTIPYGGLKILQNFSRDYIISKLDFRVRYDADIEKIRKIIKRINKELMANVEISKGMLSDIKSMGVRKMEDSAMILRIKFKSVPGHQFVVEKELYRRIQEAFIRNGIEFAHRNVTVYLPPEVHNIVGSERVENKDLLRAALTGAAAEAAAVAPDEEQGVLSSKKKADSE